MRNTVSDPSRGLGSFLPKANLSLQEHHKPVSGPSRGLDSFLHASWRKNRKKGTMKFPSPIEVSVSSYLTIGINGVNADEFPAPLEG